MRIKKAFYNIITSSILQVVTLVCGLILPRLILSYYGSAYNGLVSSIVQYLDYISILTLGLAGSVRVAIYQAKATDNITKISSALKSYQNHMNRIGIAFFIYLIILMFIYPFIVKDEFNRFDVITLIAIIGMTTFAEYFWASTCQQFLLANQSLYVANIIEIIARIVSTIISILLIINGFSIQLVKLLSSFCFVIGPISLNYITYKKYGIIRKIAPDENALKNRKDVLANSIANTIHASSDIFLLTIFQSAKVISVYTVYTFVFSALTKILGIFTSGLEGAFGEIWAKQDKKLFRETFNTFEFLVLLFVSIVFSTTAMLILSFIKIYTNGINDINYIIPVFAYLSVISYGIYCIRVPYVTAVQAAGKYKETKIGAMIEAGLNFSCSLILVKPLGLVGVVIGTLTANCFRTIQYSIFVSKNLIERSMKFFIKRIFWLLICVTSIMTLYFLTSLSKWDVASYRDWIIKAIVCMCLSIIITLFFAFLFFRKDTYNGISLFLKMVKMKKKQ